MPNLKKSWKNTGTGMGHALRGLGKTIINSGKQGVDKAVEWAGREDAPAENAAPAADGTPVCEAVPAQEAAPEKQQSAPAAKTSVADEIRKLAELKEQGILTEEEFTAKKKQLLGL